MKLMIVLSLLSVPLVLDAQYAEEWHLSQNYWEVGTSRFDVNQDGTRELTKSLFNTVTMYDGANNYQVLWSVVNNTHDELILWDIYQTYDGGDSMAIFLANNVAEDVATRILGYHVLGNYPIWETGDFAGYVSNLDAQDINRDGQKEVVLGLNDYQSPSGYYVSKFYVLDCLTGSIEFQSSVYQGFMIGPYVGNLEGDNTPEILFNIYYPDTTSILYLFAYQGSSISQSAPPPDFSVHQNFPNPFNSTTAIPLQLTRQSDVEVSVVNVQGRIVAGILAGNMAPGYHLLHWNGQDASGIPVASGMYFYEVRIGNNRIRRPMVLVR